MPSKENVAPIEDALKKVKNLQGIRFQYDDEKDFHFGFVAQDVEKVCPEVVRDMRDGEKAMAYADLVAVLVEAIKEQQKQIEELQSIVYKKESDVMLLREQIDECCRKNNEKSATQNGINTWDNLNETETKDGVFPKTSFDNGNEMIPGTVARLFQNTPNPFSANTEIHFEIPDDATSAQLMICNLNGVEIKSYHLTQRGTGDIVIQGSEFAAGMYLYALLVDNQIVDTKKMILTK